MIHLFESLGKRMALDVGSGAVLSLDPIAYDALKMLIENADADIPTAELDGSDLNENGEADIITMLVKSGLTPSRSEARRAVEQGGVTVDGEKGADVKATFSADVLKNGVLLRRGKKAFKKVVIK